MLNSEFANRQAGVFAAYLQKAAGTKIGDQVELGLTRVYQRRPSPRETERGLALIESLKKDGIGDDVALKYFCLMTYNFNEFLYLD